MCSRANIPGSEHYIKEFVRNVDVVLQQHNGEFAEDFELKFEFSSELVIHLDKWVRFAAVSQAKNIVFDLVSADFIGRYDRYLLTTELLDSGISSRLQNLQLVLVSIKLPSQFSGFPNLRKLDLQLIDIEGSEMATRGGEWEPIKLSLWNLAYIPKSTRTLSLLTRSKPSSYRQAIGLRSRARNCNESTDRC
jgi:hypothetical protein